jgi:hypothetical protein
VTARYISIVVMHVVVMLLQCFAGWLAGWLVSCSFVCWFVSLLLCLLAGLLPGGRCRCSLMANPS